MATTAGPDSPEAEADGPAEGRARFRDVVAVAEFRALWLSQGLTVTGDQLAGLAIAVVVYQRTESALLTAFTYALTLLPPLIGGPLLSALADIFPRRRVMIVCDLTRASLIGLMALPDMPLGALWLRRAQLARTWPACRQARRRRHRVRAQR